MKVHPHLNFDGITKEAFNFYKSIFDGLSKSWDIKNENGGWFLGDDFGSFTDKFEIR